LLTAEEVSQQSIRPQVFGESDGSEAAHYGGEVD